jgi:hypothetical protein
MLARTGGLIRSNAEGPSILLLNAQTRVAPVAIGEVSDQMEKNLLLPISLANKPSANPVADALNALADSHTAAVIVIGDEPGYPSLLVAPENRWALVNVAALEDAGVSTAILTERTRKEMWRAFGYLMGAAHSLSEHCLLKSVFSPSDLDALDVMGISPEPFNKFMEHAQRMGMKPIRLTTYRKAVEAGWAPAPTNDIQRTIWQEIKKRSEKANTEKH